MLAIILSAPFCLWLSAIACFIACIIVRWREVKQAIAEVAAAAKKEHLTLKDKLVQLYKKYGVHRETLVSIAFADSLSGMKEMNELMQKLRKNPPTHIGESLVVKMEDGVELARKHHLPEPFIHIIREHHGTTLVYYFYHKALELKGSEVDEKAFRYPGPKPRTRESAVIMICDGIEAASRSIDEINEEALTKLVNELITERAEDGQFDECQLTFEELGKVKTTLVKTLLLSHHVRIKYPKKEKPDSSDT